LSESGWAQAETLSDAIALAYQTNPTLRAERAGLRATDEGYVQARSALGPTISVSAQESFQSAHVDEEPLFSKRTTVHAQATTGSVNLSLVQPLYTAGQLDTRLDAAAADVRAGREQLRQTEAQVLQAVVQAYLDVRRDQQVLAVAGDEVDALKRQLDEVRAKDVERQVTRTDVSQAEARWLAARAQRQLAEGRLQASRAAYLAVVGQNPGDLAPEPGLEGVPATLDQAFDAAEANNPRFRASVYAEAAARSRVAEAKAAYGPSISLRVEAGASPVVPYQARDYDRNVTVSALYNQPLFTSGLNASRVREAAERANQETLNVEAAHRAAIEAVAQAWDGLSSARAALGLQEDQLKAEASAFEGNRIEQRVGLRTTIDVLNAEQEYQNARITLLQARHDEYLGRVALLAAMGLLEVRRFSPDVDAYRPEVSLNRNLRLQTPWTGAVEALDRIGAPRSGRTLATTPKVGSDRPLDKPLLPPAEPAQ